MQFDWRGVQLPGAVRTAHLVVGEGRGQPKQNRLRGLTQRRMVKASKARTLLPPQGKQYRGGYDGRATIGFLTHLFSSHVTQNRDSLPPGKKEAVVVWL